MRSGIGRLRRHTVTIHTKTDSIFRGVLIASYRDCLVLDLPVYLPNEDEPDKEEKPLGGQAVFPLDNIDYFQIERIA